MDIFDILEGLEEIKVIFTKKEFEAYTRLADEGPKTFYAVVVCRKKLFFGRTLVKLKVKLLVKLRVDKYLFVRYCRFDLILISGAAKQNTLQ